MTDTFIVTDEENAAALAEWTAVRESALPAVTIAFREASTEALLEVAVELYRSLDGARELAFRNDVFPAMEAIAAAGITAERVAGWMATVTLGAREFYALAPNQQPRLGLTKTWVTMLDDRVRPLHQTLHGVTVGARDTFDLDGVPTRYPGEPVGPIEHWINCRCHLRRGVGVVAAGTVGAPAAAVTTNQFNVSGGTMDGALLVAPVGNQWVSTGNVTAAAITPMDELEDDPEVPAELITPEAPMQWHAVMTVEGKPSGDRRSFDRGALSWRDLPLPLEWQRITAPEHDGAEVVGSFSGIARLDDMICTWGTFANNQAADDVIGLIGDGHIRGISPTVDDIEEAAYAGDPNDPRPMRTLAKGRICSGTIVNVPAFAEAYLALGPPPDEWLAMAASAAVDETPWDDEFEDYRERNMDQRKELARKGEAMPDGSYPIHDLEDLRNAIQAIGRAKNPAAVKRHIKKRARALGHPELIPEGWASDDDETFARGPGWVTDPVATRRIHAYWTHGKGAAKIGWGTPHDFYRCRRHLAKYVGPNYLNGVCAQWHHDALGYWPNAGPHKGKHGHAAEVETMSESVDCQCDSMVLVASAPSAAVAARTTPAEWFDNPHLPGPTPLMVEPNGRIYGHLATWGVCHIGIDGRCIEPPHSRTNYAYFRTGVALTDQGDVPAGVLTMNTLHAAADLGHAATVAHYENTGTITSVVAAGEDDHGIWVAGSMLPMNEGDFARFRAATLSGDWRWIGGGLELVGALVVNVPGFPVPRLSLAASGGRMQSLVAAGVVPHLDGDLDAAVERVLAAREAAAARRARAAVVAAAVRAERLSVLVNI